MVPDFKTNVEQFWALELTSDTKRAILYENADKLLKTN
jgi:hypothetical protein